MKSHILNFLTVGVYAWFGCITVFFLLSLMQDAPRLLLRTVHYLLAIGIFALVFRQYYKMQPHKDVFTTTVFAFLALVLLQVLLTRLIGIQLGPFLNYFDWIFPMFLIVTTVYFSGK